MRDFILLTYISLIQELIYQDYNKGLKYMINLLYNL